MKRFKAVLHSRYFLIGFLVSVGLLGITARPSTSPRSIAAKHKRDTQIATQLIIREQKNPPLRLSLDKGESFTATTPQLNVLVTNISARPIRAYAVRYDLFADESHSGGADLTNKESMHSVLLPGHSEVAGIGEGTYTKPIDRVEVSIDFVEFTDGATWGPDTYKHGEQLAGMRIGAQTASKLFNKILKSGGPVAVINSIESSGADIVPPSDHSPEWIKGFEIGISAVRERLRHAYTEGGPTRIEMEIRRPFDASGWR